VEFTLGSVLKNTQISILGGGAAGIAVGYYANQKKIPFRLFELSDQLGGNCRTFKHQKYLFDSGAHRLHDQDPETTTMIQSLLGHHLALIDVPSQIYLEKKFINFPLSPWNIAKFLGIKKFSIAIFQVLRGYFKSSSADNFHDLCLSRYGKMISTLFLLHYSEKLWGVPAHLLSPKVAGKRLTGLNVKSFILDRWNGRQVSHLDGKFYYPKKGIETIFTAMTGTCDKQSFQLNTKITKIRHQQQRITSITLNNHKKISVEEVVSTLPLGILFQLLDPAPPENLLKIAQTIQFRNVLLVAIFLNKPTINANGSMYFPSNKYPFTRIYEPKNRSLTMSPKDKTSLIVEIPCQSNSDLWKTNQQIIINQTISDLVDIGFFKLSDVESHCLQRIHNAYPVMKKGFEQQIQPLFEYLKQFSNLHLSGRNSLFSYTHIHDQIKEGRGIIQSIESELLMLFQETT
jgi:protoporphyrinogen oxidase